MESGNHFKNGANLKRQISTALLCVLLFCGKYAYSQTTARIENIWQTHDVYNGNERGMNIHIKFSFTDMLNKTGWCAAYFYGQTGSVLKGPNQRYSTADGHVSTGVQFTPNIADGIYNDFVLFIPYAAFHLPDGRQDLKFSVIIFDNNARSIAQSNFQEFQVDWSRPTYAQPSQGSLQQATQTQTGGNTKFDGEKRTSINVGVLMGGGSLIGADLEFLVGKRIGLQLGAGISSVGLGINCHLQPCINSQFVSIQYWHQGFGDNHYASYLGPTYNFRARKILQLGVGFGAVLTKGPMWKTTYTDKNEPPFVLIYNIGLFFPL